MLFQKMNERMCINIVGSYYRKIHICLTSEFINQNYIFCSDSFFKYTSRQENCVIELSIRDI